MSNISNNSGKAKLLPAALTDFDDTAAQQNVAELLLRRFGHPGWTQVRDQFRARKISLKEYQEVTFRQITATRAEMQDYVKERANLRPGFHELWRHCQEAGLPLAIVSHGLDFYIEALLEKEGLSQIPYYAVHTNVGPAGLEYIYNYTSPGQEHLGNFKCWTVAKYRKLGHHILYAGDGRSDFCPASKADLAFAHSTLAQELTQKGLPFRPFRDFYDVLTAVRELSQA